MQPLRIYDDIRCDDASRVRISVASQSPDELSGGLPGLLNAISCTVQDINGASTASLKAFINSCNRDILELLAEMLTDIANGLPEWIHPDSEEYRTLARRIKSFLGVALGKKKGMDIVPDDLRPIMKMMLFPKLVDYWLFHHEVVLNFLKQYIPNIQMAFERGGQN